jgi:hypothetical protein
VTPQQYHDLARTWGGPWHDLVILGACALLYLALSVLVAWIVHRLKEGKEQP